MSALADKQDHSQLQYDHSSPHPLARRAYRLLVAMTFLTLVNTVILSAVLLGPQLTPWVRAQWDQWQAKRAERRHFQAQLAVQQRCLTYSPPAGKVVYEEDPAEGARLLTDAAEYEPAMSLRSRNYYPPRPMPPGWEPPVRVKQPDAFREFMGRINTGRFAGGGGFGSSGYPGFGGASRIDDPEGALLFLHERTSPGGMRCLVVVRLTSGFDFTASAGGLGESLILTNKRRVLEAVAYTPATADSPKPSWKAERTVVLRLPDSQGHIVARADSAGGTAPPQPTDSPPAVKLDYGNTLRFFAGQPDPADASHFTLSYRLDGRDGTVDGWLKDDGLLLKPRGGRLSFEEGKTMWDLTPSDK